MLPSAIRVRLNHRMHSITLDQTKPLSFQDLTRNLELGFKDIQVSSYDIVMEGHGIIHNNQTLQQAMEQTAATNTPPDISLLPKHNHSKNNMVPIIKPTVLRWTDHQDNLHRYPSSQMLGKRTSMEQQQCHQSMIPSQVDGSSIRKDSGISMDEPTTVKKQRVMSADQLATSSLTTGKLAYLSPPPRYNMQNNIRAPSPSPSSHSSIHPLEMRRPSTAPSSPSYSRRPSNFSPPTTIKLPALLSITSSTPLENNLHHLPKLAPLQQPTSQRQKCHLPAINSPHPATNGSIRRTPSTGSGSLPTSSPRSTEQREPNSIQYYQHHQPSQQKQPGQFLCEQVLNPFSGRICGQTFRRSYDLSRHQTIHLKNRPFCYCHQCGKKFTRMDALRRHERVQGHNSKQHVLQQTPSLQSPGSPSSPSPPQQRNQKYSNPTTAPTTPSPSSEHAVSVIHLSSTTQQARV